MRSVFGYYKEETYIYRVKGSEFSMLQQSKEELQEMALIELAFQIFKEKGEAISFQELLDEIGANLGLSKNEMQEKMVQFYTDLNIDGRFMTLGENRWGLREWYPMDQIDEEVVMPTKTKKKKKSKKALKEEEEDLLEDLEEEELDYDLEDDEVLLDDDEEEDEDESLEALQEEEFEDEEEFEEDLIDEEEYDIDEEEEEDVEEEEK
ncbi:DNA-directed RNA polymerase subunit delta [Lederbergia sp. NSJ-179]|uniref:DNA-directed RNA polymerase subunit delta n=1 Tax=Lederbergia sp. NSJ-179 TaxID=2931402 RepID=UPI002456D6BD|nr:DNA-directed RNA polymerase subunit delta [Lederbergia sp. NSJ-179]